MRETDIKHDNFLKAIADSTHYKYNSSVHKNGIFVELAQFNRKRQSFPTNSYWYKDDIKVLVYGNEKMQFYFLKDKLLKWIQEHPERVGVYLDGKVKGISLSLNESFKMADMVVK